VKKEVFAMLSELRKEEKDGLKICYFVRVGNNLPVGMFLVTVLLPLLPTPRPSFSADLM
jgi:hypothetical protein